ncbi:MucR family transcriptional regulator [Methylobacterium nodulans]|uniref:Transcriptional regulator, MucR family n=1 Tax=Methylobacterium nodulans (strain LMG 21967 / CNCM I-2342 / ORS 2060) TaxID=460265 RepID=B8IX51_METNO|nr:MucR family transcriptional regulator [Methylobacterium nodulans]ACL63092.1 transcriptional regulator, MucR family [Methylobacterium nodulans ORS 2060]
MADVQEATADAGGPAIELVADIISAYVAHNPVPVAQLPDLIATVSQTLDSLGKPAASAAEETPKATPAQIRKSITPDALISFIDGKPYKTLKRHLTRHGMSPDEYRSKFGLPPTYPMVAESYAVQRSELAKASGLGQSHRRTAPKQSAGDAKVTASAKSKKGSGRARKPKAAE